MPKFLMPVFAMAANFLHAQERGAVLRAPSVDSSYKMPPPMLEQGGYCPSSRQYVTRPGWRAEAGRRRAKELARRQRTNRRNRKDAQRTFAR